MKKQFALLSFIAISTMAQTLTQKIDVTVVNVDVVVTAPDGTPVRGLSRDDFQLFEDGVPQPITNFYSVGTSPATVQATTAAAPPAPAPSNDDPRFRRKVLVLIDNVHISKHARDMALDQLEKFIDDRFRGGEYDWSIATVGSRLGLIMPLTSDKQRIHETIAAIRRGGARQDATESLKLSDVSPAMRHGMDQVPSNGRAQFSPDLFSYGQQEHEREIRARFTVDAVVSAARALAAADGKKIVLLLSDNRDFNDIELTYSKKGYFIQRDFISDKQTDNFGTISREIKTLKDYIVAEANASNVSFYIIDPEGLKAPADLGLPDDPGGTSGMTNSQGLFWLAADTGGRLMPGNDLNASMMQFETRSSNFYSLGFHPSHDDAKYHKLTVKLTKPGKYDLRYRTGYSNVTSEEQLERTLRSPLAMSAHASSLPVTLLTEKAEPQKRGTVLVPFRATIPISKLQFLPDGQKWNATFDVYVSVFDVDGNNLSFNRFSSSATAPSGTVNPAAKFTYRNGVVMRTGPHRIVVAFRDRATDAVGVAESMVQTE